jgi:hypothetical protein
MPDCNKISNLVLSKLPVLHDCLSDDRNIVFAYLFDCFSTVVHSDIHIAVYLHKIDHAAQQKFEIFDRLADALEKADIDLVVLNIAPIDVAGRIMQRKALIVDKEPEKRYSYDLAILQEFIRFRVNEEGNRANRSCIRQSDALLAKISELVAYRDRLSEFSGVAAEDLRVNRKWQLIVGRTLQLLIETCADIAPGSLPIAPCVLHQAMPTFSLF